MLARYFMFVQVYFHRTRRFLDKMLVDYLKGSLAGGRYPGNVNDYLAWDDARVWGKIKEDEKTSTYAERLINRRIMKMVYESPTHSNVQEKRMYNLIKTDLQNKFGNENLLFDSADKMTHKIPLRHEIDNEKAIPILLDYSDEPSTISIESGIINKMTEPININIISSNRPWNGEFPTPEKFPSTHREIPGI